MKKLIIYLKSSVLVLMILLASSRAKSEERDLADYCMVGYYASSATATFKTPFIIDFGANNTFNKLEVDGKLHQGKYTIAGGNLKLAFAGGEENYQINGETVTPKNSRTFARLERKVADNKLKGNRYTGILYRQNATTVLRSNYQFIANKFGMSDENTKGMAFNEYTLVGSMAGYRLGGIKSLYARNLFVQYGNQLLVMNIYKDGGVTYGILDQGN